MHYENNWESLNSRPVPDWFADAKFGIFIHWGLYSVPAYTEKGQYAEWYMQQIRDKNSEARKFHDRVYAPGTQYEDFVSGFKAELFDADEWAQLFEKSGAKYINLVSKHHDGFCLFKSDYAWNWNSVDVGPHRDFCRELKTALEKTDVKFGVYHSVYEWFHPLFLKDPEEYAVKHFIPMLKELITKYEPWTLFTDGEWDHPSSVWHSTEFLQWLYNESPVKDTIVPNDRWGKETRGRLGGNFTTEYGYIDNGRRIEDVELDRPFEECRGIGASFGLNRIEGVDEYLSSKELIETLCSLVSKGGNSNLYNKTDYNSGFEPGRQIGVSFYSDMLEFQSVGFRYNVAVTNGQTALSKAAEEGYFAAYGRLELGLKKSLYGDSAPGTFFTIALSGSVELREAKIDENDDTDSLGHRYRAAGELHARYKGIEADFEAIWERYDVLDLDDSLFVGGKYTGNVDTKRSINLASSHRYRIHSR